MNCVGGCLCGAVRYEASTPPLDVGYCHCRMCQKVSGAPVLPWASYAVESFAYTASQPQIYRSSAHGQREFCAQCGSQIAFRATDENKTVEINVGTLEDPTSVCPQYHIWCDSQISWFDIHDDLPRHPRSGPIGEGN